MRRFSVWCFLGALSALSLSGCGSGTAALNQTPAIRDLAASFVAARAFDAATIALRHEDQAGLRQAGQKLKKADDILSKKQFLEMSLALTMVGAAFEIERKISGSNSLQRATLRAEANERYRTALDLLPENTSNLDAESANALGYFLAGQGTTQTDFKRAVELTEDALAKSTKAVAVLPAGDFRRPQAEFERASGPRDSYAWALFRAGRLKEARQEEEEALRVLRGLDAFKGSISAEIPYHMAEIYRALGQKSDARREYQAALALQPDPELNEQIELALKALG